MFCQLCNYFVLAGHFGVKKTLAGVQGQDFGSAATIIFQKCDDCSSRNSFLSRLQECPLYVPEIGLKNEALEHLQAKDGRAPDHTRNPPQQT